MSKFELGIFVDPYASARAKEEARRIVALTNCAPLTFPLRGNLPQVAVFACGDGPLQKIAQVMVESNQVIPIALLGGGTNDALYNSLRGNDQDGKTQFSFADFQNHIKENRPFHPEALIKPGLIGGKAFLRDVGLGPFEQNAGKANKRLNGWVPKGLRVQTASVLGLVLTILSNPDTSVPLDIYTISPWVGRKRVFPKQVQHGDQITHAWIESSTRGELRRALIRTAAYGQSGLPSPHVRTEQQTSFTLQSVPDHFWLHGDIIPNDQTGLTVVKRWDKGIPIVAIDY